MKPITADNPADLSGIKTEFEARRSQRSTKRDEMSHIQKEIVSLNKEVEYLQIRTDELMGNSLSTRQKRVKQQFES
jgi:predicted HTH domain antitoxin